MAPKVQAPENAVFGRFNALRHVTGKFNAANIIGKPPTQPGGKGFLHERLKGGWIRPARSEAVKLFHRILSQRQRDGDDGANDDVDPKEGDPPSRFVA